ncbi:MAG TPA: hypothetical protein ENJ24_00425 [Gammaproteobacteria bacterium]|nr:hypothetical protein [Gammaproteobacteria bacterium]
MKKTGITISTKNQPTEKEISPDQLEPAFYLSECRSLQIDTEKLGDKAANYLTHGVARTPANLIAQIQRVNIYLAQRDAEGVYGALLDLFIALGDKGLLIRRRMLLRAKPLLSEEQLQALALRLDTGVSATDPMPPSTHSVLSKGLTGIRQLVVRIDDAKADKRDPLEDAIEYLEYSQIDKAREVLERALLEDPSRMDLHSNLLAIYRASNDLGNFTTMRNRLDKLKNPVPDEWKQLAKHFAT